MATIVKSPPQLQPPALARCKRTSQSRNEVLSEARNATGWTVLDDEEDLQMCTLPERIRPDSRSTPRATSSCTRPTEITYALQNIREHTFGRLTQRHNSLSNPFKKSLFSSEAYRQQTQEANRKEKQASVQENTRPSMVDIHDNSETANGWSFQCLDRDKDMVGGVLENEEEEARYLASMTNKDLMSTVPVSDTKPFDLLQDAKRSDEDGIVIEQLEKAGEERSRLLRQRALARRSDSTQELEDYCPIDFNHKLDKNNNNVASETGNSIDTVSWTESQQWDDLPQTDTQLGLNMNQPVPINVDNLFDIAYKSTTVVSRKHNCTTPHAASRAAADRYRTQSRHLEDGMAFTKDSHLEECERRLRAYTCQLQPCTTTMFELPSPSTQRDNTRSTTKTEDLAGENDQQIPAMNIEMSVPTATTIDNFEPATMSPTFPPLRPTLLASQKSPLHTVKILQPRENFNSYPEEPPDLALPKTFDHYNQEQKDIVIEHETMKERLRDLEAVNQVFEQTARAGALDGFNDLEAKEITTIQQFKHAVIDKSLSGKIMRRRVNEIRANMIRRIQKFEPVDELRYEALLDRMFPKEQRDRIAQLISITQNNIDHLATLRRERHGKSQGRSKKRTRVETSGHETKLRKPKRVRFSLDVLQGSAESTDPFETLPDGAEIELPGANTLSHPSIALTERKRNAQYLAADRRGAAIQHRLAMFTQPETHSALSNDSDHMAEAHDSDSESQVSEEEEGAELFAASASFQNLARPVIDHENTMLQGTNEASDLTEGRLELMDQQPASSQAQDEYLASKMQQTQRQRAISVQQGMQRPNSNLMSSLRHSADEASEVLASHDNDLEQEMGQEFDDLDDSDFDEDSVCYRYIVKAHYANVPGFDTESEYYRKFLNSKKAAAELANWVKELRERYKQSTGTKENLEITETIVENAGLSERTIELGRDGRMSCRAWIEKEEYNPSRNAYKNAKVRRACNAKPVYTVRWEKTIAPVSSEHDNDEQGNGQADCKITQQSLPLTGLDGNREDVHGGDGLADLFESSPLPPSHEGTTSAAVTTQIGYEAQRYFTNIALANRHAKDVFMRWYMNHKRGPEHFQDIRLEEDAIERQIESYGDTLTWEREDDFDYYDDSDGGAAAVVSDGIPAAAATMPSGRTTLCNEKFRIWVETVPVTGPAN